MKKYFNVIVRLYDVKGRITSCLYGCLTTYENMIEAFCNEYYVSACNKQNVLHIRLKNNETKDESLFQLKGFQTIEEDIGFILPLGEMVVHIEITDEVKDLANFQKIEKELKNARRKGEW